MNEVSFIQRRAARRSVQDLGAVGAEDGVRATAPAKRLGVAPLVRRVVVRACVDINQCVGCDIATPSSRHRVDGVKDDGAVKF